MQKPKNAEYIKEIIESTNGLGYMDIQGDSTEEKQTHFAKLIKEKLADYHNDNRENNHYRS